MTDWLEQQQENPQDEIKEIGFVAIP